MANFQFSGIEGEERRGQGAAAAAGEGAAAPEGEGAAPAQGMDTD